MTNCSEVFQMVEKLLKEMTLREKIGQLNQPMLGWHVYRRTGGGFELTENFMEFVSRFGSVGGVYGLFRADPWSGMDYTNGVLPSECAELANTLQKYLAENTRLKIPAFISEEMPHGHQALGSAVFPVNIGMASTFNNELHSRIFALAAMEVRSKGGNLALVSALDVLRDPRWGRSEETYGEDPFLASAFAESLVRGVQSVNGIGAVVKHFCAQGGCAGGRNIHPANIGPRELREIHVPPMRGAADAGALGCMAAYTEIDGEPCHANERLLNGILRNECGFDGFVMSDLGAIDRNTIQTGSLTAAAAVSLNAGVDISLCDEAYKCIEAAVENGEVSVEAVDRSVLRILKAKERLGLFDNPYTDVGEYKAYCGTKELRDANLEAAEESIVLLKNNILPLDRNIKSLAVIGPHIYEPDYLQGDYVSQQESGQTVTVLEGIKKVFPKTEIYHSKGCTVRGKSTDGFKDAVEAAKKSEVIILTLGGSSAREFAGGFEPTGAVKTVSSESEMDCGEGADVASLKLGGVQTELFYELEKLGKPIVAVLIQGRPYAIPEIAEKADALLCAWYPGQTGGEAIARIIAGYAVPSGKLPVSFPISEGQLLVYYNYKDIGKAPSYTDMTGEPLFEFGFGLSYTEFEYLDIKAENQVSIEELKSGKSTEVKITLKNAGNVDAKEVVQLYVKDTVSSVTHRVKELKGYKKILVKAGETVCVGITLSYKDFALYDRELKFIAEKGSFELTAGGSSKTKLAAIIQLV